MEHFIAPQGGETIEVPYVGTEDYDGDDFMSYPLRKGWSEDDLMGLNSFGGRSEAREEVEAFFQTWLYFGCLISLFSLVGVKVQIQDFVRETARGEKVITTSLLPGFIQDWMNREGMADEYNREMAPDHNPEMVDLEAKYKRGQIIETIFQRVWFFVDTYCSFEGQERAKKFGIQPQFWPISPKVAMSIMAIGKPLQHIATQIYGYRGWTYQHWGSSSYLNERLAKAGWCIREIPIFGETASVGSDYYFGSYPSPRKKLNHKECTKIVCCAKNVDVGLYRTKHVTADCRCRPMRSALKKIRAIVKKGAIPIISWRDGRLLAAEYDKEGNGKYVAISHVWSDGMGNANHNSLPECQLTRLQGFVDLLYTEEHALPTRKAPASSKLHSSSDDRVGFWMDTLCVPVGKKYTEYRQAAIRKMKDIYQSADRVLVLDSFIQDVPRSASITDKCVRLYLSNWHRRLWTLQEGLLGHALFFQFKDAAQTIADMYPEARAEHKSLVNFYSSIRGSCMASFDPFYDMINASVDIVSKFHTFAYSMRSRTTTRSDDEPICFASTLGLDPNPLFPHKGEKRMEKFYELVGRFNPRILFNEFPRLKADGFRWAPRSFLGQSYNPFPVPDKLGVPDATLDNGGGLRVTFAGAKLQVGAVEAHFGTTLYLVPRDHSSCWYALRLRPDTEGNYPSWSPEATYLILSFEPIQDVPSFNKGVTSEAILGTLISTESDGSLRIRYECRAIVELLDQRGLSRLKKRSIPFLERKKKIGKDERGFDGRYPVIIDWYNASQNWCVM